MLQSLTFANSDLTPLIGPAITLLATALGVIYYFKNKKSRRLVYDYDNHLTFMNNTEPPTLIYPGTRTGSQAAALVRFHFWNDGNSTLTWSDHVAVNDTPRVAIPVGARLLRAEVSSFIPACDVTVVPSARDASIEFDFLDGNQGATIRLQHSGHPGRMKVTGYIKGSGYLTKSKLGIPRGAMKVLYALLQIIMMMGGILFFLNGGSGEVGVAGFLVALAGFAGSVSVERYGLRLPEGIEITAEEFRRTHPLFRLPPGLLRTLRRIDNKRKALQRSFRN